jgi:hypothetical protein
MKVGNGIAVGGISWMFPRSWLGRGDAKKTVKSALKKIFIFYGILKENKCGRLLKLWRYVIVSSC